MSNKVVSPPRARARARARASLRSTKSLDRINRGGSTKPNSSLQQRDIGRANSKEATTATPSSPKHKTTKQKSNNMPVSSSSSSKRNVTNSSSASNQGRSSAPSRRDSANSPFNKGRSSFSPSKRNVTSSPPPKGRCSPPSRRDSANSPSNKDRLTKAPFKGKTPSPSKGINASSSFSKLSRQSSPLKRDLFTTDPSPPSILNLVPRSCSNSNSNSNTAQVFVSSSSSSFARVPVKRSASSHGKFFSSSWVDDKEAEAARRMRAAVTKMSSSRALDTALLEDCLASPTEESSTGSFGLDNDSDNNWAPLDPSTLFSIQQLQPRKKKPSKSLAIHSNDNGNSNDHKTKPSSNKGTKPKDPTTTMAAASAAHGQISDFGNPALSRQNSSASASLTFQVTYLGDAQNAQGQKIRKSLIEKEGSTKSSSVRSYSNLRDLDTRSRLSNKSIKGATEVRPSSSAGHHPNNQQPSAAALSKTPKKHPPPPPSSLLSSLSSSTSSSSSSSSPPPPLLYPQPQRAPSNGPSRGMSQTKTISRERPELRTVRSERSVLALPPYPSLLTAKLLSEDHLTYIMPTTNKTRVHSPQKLPVAKFPPPLPL